MSIYPEAIKGFNVAVKKIEKGGEIGPGRTLEKGHAATVEGIDRKPLGDAIGRVHERIICESERVARLRCPLNEDCEILAAALTAYDSHPAEAVFECPRDDEQCEEIALGAAKEADRQISHANSAAQEAILKLGP
jgi:hypothetical protein